eukprot:SAG22_NODE_281_length_13064_cov_13.367605_5_plen_294_part_00
MYAPWCKLTLESGRSQLADGPVGDAFSGKVHATYRVEIYEIGRGDAYNGYGRPTGALWPAVVYRRYSDFVALDRRLRAADVSARLDAHRAYHLGPRVDYGAPPAEARQQLPVLPPKRLMKTCDETLRERLSGLRTYLDAAMQLEDPQLLWLVEAFCAGRAGAQESLASSPPRISWRQSMASQAAAELPDISSPLGDGGGNQGQAETGAEAPAPVPVPVPSLIGVLDNAADGEGVDKQQEQEQEQQDGQEEQEQEEQEPQRQEEEEQQRRQEERQSAAQPSPRKVVPPIDIVLT